MTRQMAIAGLLALALAGCAGVPLSGLEVPADLRAPCAVPPVRKGAIKSLAEHRAALLACRDKHQRLVSYVDTAAGK